MEGIGIRSCLAPPPKAKEPAAAAFPTRAAQEAEAEDRRLQTPPYHAYAGAEGHQAQDKLFREASDSIVDYSHRLVEARDCGLPFEAGTGGPPGWLGQATTAWIERVSKHFAGARMITQTRTLEDIFAPKDADAVGKLATVHYVLGLKGVAIGLALAALYRRRPGLLGISALVAIASKLVTAKQTSERKNRAHRKVASALADAIIRSRTLYHNGCTQSQMKLPPQLLASGSVRVDAKTRFERRAMSYEPPTTAEVAEKLPKTPTANTHPRLAAARHQHVTKLRGLPAELHYEQYDPFISSNVRDSPAYGDRPVNQLKDLGNAPAPPPPSGAGLVSGEKKTAKRVVTLMDCLCYANSLREYSGEDIIAWTAYYPGLAGKTDESVYYADSDTTFTEIIGLSAVVGCWKGQLAWDFTCNDVVYIENLDGSAFTVYKVYRYPHPELLKQTVFFCAIQTVNLPYSVVDLLTVWTKGHTLGSSGIGTPGPATNVKLVPRDPERPQTQDILVMSCGTPEFPTVSIKYKNATGPDSSATMTVDVYHWIKYQNGCNGRGLTTHEAIKRLELYANREEAANVPGSAAYCELLRTVAWWGDLPCVIYYDTRKKDPLPTEPPVESDTAKAVMATPKITQNMPCVLAKTPEAMEAYKREKMVGLANDVVPTADWSKIAEICVKGYVQGTSTESGVKKGTLQLIDRNKVSDSRTRAAQVARKVAFGMGPAPAELGQVANKVEPAHKTAACPRGVQSPEYDISELSGVLAKSFDPVISKLDHYDPGRSPVAIAEHLRRTYELSTEHQAHYEGGGIRCVDYTAADEKHCRLSNKILRAMIEYYFTEEDVQEALAIYDSCFNMRLNVGGSTMSSGWKNASGTGITTILNTIVFAAREMQTVIVALVFRAMEDAGELKQGTYVQDLSGRQMPYPDLNYAKFLKHLKVIDKTWELHKIAGGNRPKTSALQAVYGWIGPKFGDDGVDPSTPFVSDRLYECAMKYVDRQDGFLRKLETTDSVKEEPVEYLSRIYPNLLRSLSSFCKPEKALDKLSVAINRDRDKYILKLLGYFETDRNCPLVGALVEATSKMYNAPMRKLTDEELAAIAEHDKEAYWKLANGPFPSDEGASDLAYECVAAEYNMTSGELRDFDEKLRSQSTWAGIQAMMVPAKISKETADDPLGQAETEDPAGVARVAAISCTTRGDDPRMEDFPSTDATSKQSFSTWPGWVRTEPANADRSEAAIAALGLK